MTDSHEHDAWTDEVGAYLLGALDPDEIHAFETHLHSCERCERDVRRLTSAVDALPRSVEQFEAPRELKASLMAAVSSEAEMRRARLAPSDVKESRPRRGWREALFARPAFAAAAAALMLAIGIGAGVLVGAVGNGSDGGGSQQFAATIDSNRVSKDAEARLVVADGKDEGAILHVKGMPLPVEKDVYEVWVRRGNKVSPVSLFQTNKNGDGVAAIDSEHLEGADAVVVTREKRGGSDVPTEEPVVNVELAS